MTPWVWNGEDLHDDVIEKLEKQYKIPELSRTYRRSRWQYWLYP